MPQATGTVKAISVKNETKTGKPLRSPLYSINMNDKWFSFGFNNPGVSKGDEVAFTYNDGNFGAEGDASTVEIVSKGAAPTAVASTSSSDRQNSIIYQSSRKDAIQVVSILLDNDAVTLPTKKADKSDAIIGLIEEITDEFAFNALEPVIENPLLALGADTDE